MARFAAYLTVVGVSALLGVPMGLEAQYRPGASSELRWPAPWGPELLAPASGFDQAQRLPVYDDAGQPILFEAIQARVDRSGLKGAFWSGLAGLIGGSLLGLALSPLDCNHEEGGQYVYCSPREDALRSAMPLGLSLVGGVALAWLGWSADATSWQEALDEIRQERRIGGAR